MSSNLSKLGMHNAKSSVISLKGLNSHRIKRPRLSVAMVYPERRTAETRIDLKTTSSRPETGLASRTAYGCTQSDTMSQTNTRVLKVSAIKDFQFHIAKKLQKTLNNNAYYS